MSAAAGASEADRLATAILEGLGATLRDGAWVTPGGIRLAGADARRAATDIALIKRLEAEAGIDGDGHACRFDGRAWHASAGDGQGIASGAAASEEEARARRLAKLLKARALAKAAETRPPGEAYPRLRVWAGGFSSSGIWLIEEPGQAAAGVMVSHDRLRLPGDLAREFKDWCTYHEMFSRPDRARGEADWQAFQAKQRAIAQKLKRHLGTDVHVECRFGDDTFTV